MNIIKPLLNNLQKLEKLLEEIDKNDSIQKVLIENFDSENIEFYDIKNVIFKNTVIRNSYFEKADLAQTQFSNTSLRNIDLSDSIIEEIAISINDIKGAIINQFQAVDLLYLIGVKIK